MPFSLDEIQEAILTDLDTRVYPGQQVVERAMRDVETLARNTAGAVNPYIAVQIGDLQQWGSTSMIGPRGDDYVIPLYIMCVGDTPERARRLANQGIDRFLGASFDWAGQIRKRAGGAMYPIVKSDGAGEAYVAPLSFGIVVQLMTIPEGP